MNDDTLPHPAPQAMTLTESILLAYSCVCTLAVFAMYGITRKLDRLMTASHERERLLHLEVRRFERKPFD